MNSAEAGAVTAPSSLEAGMPLRQTRQLSKEFSALAGFVLLPLAPIVASAAFRGEWSGLWLLGIPAGLVALGRCMDYLTPHVYMVLYSDRMELPRHRGAPTIIRLSEIKGVRWAARREPDAQISIKLPVSADWPLGLACLELQSVSLADRLTLIRYLRLAAEDAEQERWASFCRRHAVPLVETLNRGEQEAPESRLAAEVRRFSQLFERHPIAAGAMSPILLVRIVSRKAWWMTAAMVAISAWINIRVIWGHWAAPFTAMTMGAAAVFFLLGLVAPAGRMSEKRADDLVGVSGLISLAVAVFGFPLLGNALALGWLALPRVVLRWLLYALLLVLSSPLLIHVVRKGRREKAQRSRREAEAIQRWEAFESTGALPDPADIMAR